MNASTGRLWRAGRRLLCLVLAARLAAPCFAGERRHKRFSYWVDRRTVADETVLIAPSWTKAAERDLEKFAEEMDLPEMEYKVRVLNTPLWNAYSTDEGFFYVTTGLLDAIKDREEWTAVAGRELYHIHHQSHTASVDAIRRERTSEAVLTAVAVVLVVGVIVLLVCAAEADDPPAPKPGRRGGSRGPRGGRPGPRHRQSPRRNPVPLSLLLVPAVAAAAAEPAPPPPASPTRGYERTHWGDIPKLWGYSAARELAADRFAMDLLRRQGGDPMALPRLLRRVQKACESKRRPVWDYPSRFLNAEPGIEERIRQARNAAKEEGTL